MGDWWHEATRWKPAQPEKIVARYRAGWSQRELAAREGVSQAAIHAFLHARGIGPQSFGPRLKSPPAELPALRDAGLTQTEISERLGVGRHLLRRWLRELG